jgi:3-phenylpropionate/trans-cinnamate dioxygenase ferredoxin reductase component
VSPDVVIVGGGLAAVRTAQALRDFRYEGNITLVSDEKQPPYDRPPLSKDYLLGRISESAVELLGQDELGALDLTVRLGDGAAGLDPDLRSVILASGTEIHYDKLVVATGARANRLAGTEDMTGVHYLRSLSDAQGLRRALVQRPRVAIVGGGFIGLEVAAVATQLGCSVTVFELATAPLRPIIGEVLGRFVQHWHEEHGVSFRCQTAVQAARGTDRLEEMVLSTGETVPVDLAVVGVGVRPNVEWLAGSGIELHRGVRTDADGHSSDPNVYAVGDARCRHEDGMCRPGGHWTAATEDATRAAIALAQSKLPNVPGQEGYFWSDQFGARMQFAGSLSGEPDLTITSGAMDDRAFVAVLGNPDRPTAVFAMNSPRQFMQTTLAMAG